MARPKGYYLAMLKARKELSALTKEQRMILSLLRKAARAGQPASVTLTFSGPGPKTEPEPKQKPVDPKSKVYIDEWAGPPPVRAESCTDEQWESYKAKWIRSCKDEVEAAKCF